MSDKNATSPVTGNIATKLNVMFGTNVNFTGTVNGGSLTATQGNNSVTTTGSDLPNGHYAFTTDSQGNVEATLLNELGHTAAAKKDKKVSPARTSTGSSTYSVRGGFGTRC